MVEPAERRLPRWMRIVFGLSLGLNFLIFGAIVGAILSGTPHDRVARLADGAGPYTRALSIEDRRILARQFFMDRTAFRRDERELRESYQQMQALLRAPSFDQPAAEAIMTRQREIIARQSSHGQSLLAVRFSEMSQEARVAYADRLEEAMKGPPRPDRAP